MQITQYSSLPNAAVHSGFWSRQSLCRLKSTKYSKDSLCPQSLLESGENIWNALTSENRLSWPTMRASLIDVSIDCKTDKKKRLSVAHRLPGATKNESVYFKTVYFVLLAVKAKEIKKGAQFTRRRSQGLSFSFTGHVFSAFKKPARQAPWQPALTRCRGREKRRQRGDKTKHKNSNICSRFQPDSLMWITQHFVPWPWRTKRGGGRCLRSGAGHPGRRASREHRCSFRWAGVIVPRQGEEVPPGHPALHATWTVIVSAQRWPLDKRGRAVRE